MHFDACCCYCNAWNNVTGLVPAPFSHLPQKWLNYDLGEGK